MTITETFRPYSSIPSFSRPSGTAPAVPPIHPPSLAPPHAGLLSGNVLHSITIATAVGAGVVGGVLFAFSTFVMPALRSLPDSQGMSAMQAINRFAPTALFMAVLFGTAIVAIVLGVSAVAHLDDTAAWWRLAGCVLYLATIVITAAYHVPQNNALAAVSATSAHAAGIWHRYASGWTALNSVRAATAIAACICFAGPGRAL
ncbi:MAG TPA: anthrone oxygenase family protein [Acidimicrobiales bacterium]|nr:anthrone oxygenase family protein [Acidimicrobiales bacterium]